MPPNSNDGTEVSLRNIVTLLNGESSSNDSTEESLRKVVTLLSNGSGTAAPSGIAVASTSSVEISGYGTLVKKVEGETITGDGLTLSGGVAYTNLGTNPTAYVLFGPPPTAANDMGPNQFSGWTLYSVGVYEGGDVNAWLNGTLIASSVSNDITTIPTTGWSPSITFPAAPTSAIAAVTAHSADTTAVHGIANTASLVLTNDLRLSDPRRALSYPVLSETLFSGVTVEKRVHTRSYNSGEQSWETNVAITQLPLVLDTYHDPAVIYENGEEGWSLEKSPSVAFGTSNTSGLIFESDDEGVKIMRLGTIVVPPLPNPAPPTPYTTQATFIESFSATLTKAGDWYSSAFASKWDSVSPSRNIFNSSTSPLNDQSETIKDWQLETLGNSSFYDSFNVAMASPNILLRCSKRYTSWTNGVSPSVEGNGNIIVEIIFYGTPLAKIAGGSITTSKVDQINLGVTGGSITSDGYGGNINTSGFGGSISTSGYGGSINTGHFGGSIITGPYGGAIDTTGQGSIELGSVTAGALGAAYGKTILKGSASGASAQTITLPNETGTIALAPRVAYGGIISASAVDAFSGVGTYAMIQGSGMGGSIQVDANGVITIASAGTGYVDGQAIRAGGSRYNLVTQATQPASANLPVITKAGGGITNGTFGTTANSFCQGNDARLGSQTIFALGGDSKTTFELSNSYLYGAILSREPKQSSNYLNAVLKILGNFTVTGMTIHQYLPSSATATFTYQLVRVTNATTVEALSSSIVVAGNNNLTTAVSSPFWPYTTLNSGDRIGLMLTLGSLGSLPIATSPTSVLANLYCVPR